MASAASNASFLPPVLTFCAAAAVAVPLFRRLGLGAVPGYLAAGLVIGPSGLGLISDPETARSVAELGVVLLLFIVGLELKFPRLWAMRRDILGLGLAQLALTAAALGLAATAAGAEGVGAAVIGVALALSATSITLQILEERDDLQTGYGRRSLAILLFQDLSIVPILAALPLLASRVAPAEGGWGLEAWLAVGEAVAALAAVVLVGRYALNPAFGLLARSGAREVMTASALLVVLGAALLMEQVGLSMAMGAFLAGVLLAESRFRHQLEADIEPFRGILLGLFFMSVGMAIDGALVAREWRVLAIATPAVLAVKIVIVTILVRVFGSPWREAARAGAVLSPAGEFAFVLIPLAASFALLPGPLAQFATALAALTMLVGPLAAKGLDILLDKARRREPDPEPDAFDGPAARVLVIGFGRFGQAVNQILLAQGLDVTVIDREVEQIRNAAQFGFRVYYGDGTRRDVLQAAGAAKAELVCVCIDDRKAALTIVELLHEFFPQARTFVRAYDRIHAIELMKRDVDYQTRELFESAMAFGRATLEELGVAPEAAAGIVDDVRKRDIARLMMQKAQGLMAGADLLHGARLRPEPLTTPKARPKALSPETGDIIGHEPS